MFPQQQNITNKNQKTTSNQTTKFHQLQAIFGGQNQQHIANMQNNMLNSKNSSTNVSLENINLINSENEASFFFFVRIYNLNLFVKFVCLFLVA